jgi:thiol-disulfide isomerase/thioredoxin
MARKNFLAFSSLAVALVFSAGSLAAPMPQEQFDALVEQYDAKMAEMRAAGSMKLADALALQAEFVDKFPISDLTLGQLQDLSKRNLITTYKPGSDNDRTDEALAALTPLTTGNTVEAVEALALKAQLLDSNNPDNADITIDVVSRLLTHPKFPEALRENRAQSVWYSIGYGVDSKRVHELSEELAIAATNFPLDPQAASLAGLTTVYEKAAASKDEATLNAAERLRAKAVTALSAVMEGDDDDAKKFAKRELASLEAAPRIAQLVGNTAPELDFTWSSGGETLRSLADLRGKVVVLDFWATWCGPCISSFPQVRDLAAHYAGYPVEIVGVTSLQGATYFEAGKKEAATPADEHADMRPFMEEKDITWTVAFTEQEVFNPEYGVRGIPHVVIIDPDGKIVHRALHPASSLDKKAALIDPILEQFGLEHPPTPVAKEETKGGQ